MHPPPSPAFCWGEGGEPPTKWGAWQDLNFERRVAGKEGETFIRWGEGEGFQFYKKKTNKLRFEIFNDKKRFINKYFSLSKLRIQTGKFWQRILLLLKDKMGLRMKDFDILGIHWKIRLLGGEFTKKWYRGGDCLERGSLDSLHT